MANHLVQLSSLELTSIAGAILDHVFCTTKLDVVRRLVGICRITPDSPLSEENRELLFGALKEIYLQSNLEDGLEDHLEEENTMVNICWAFLDGADPLDKVDSMFYHLSVLRIPTNGKTLIEEYLKESASKVRHDSLYRIALYIREITSDVRRLLFRSSQR